MFPVATNSFHVRNLTAGLKTLNRDSVLRAVARARGAVTGAQQREFLADLPDIGLSIRSIPAYQRARDRLTKAVAGKERVSLLGDYDVDGVSALAVMLDLLRAAGCENVRCYIPERAIEDYGFTQKAARNCIEAQQPSLIFTVDCGSPSLEVIKDVQAGGIDVLVLDHHHVTALPDGGHPAFAHLNPKDPACCDGNDELQTLCAGALAFLFAEAFAKDTGVSNWSRDRALVIAGFSTYADVMTLTGANRAIVKHSLALINARSETLVPGLHALKAATFVSKITTHTYGFVFGPHLNASGRLARAQDSLRVLAATSVQSAEKTIPGLIIQNAERKLIQQPILEEAAEMVEVLIAAQPARKMVVVAKKEWHPGVVGIVAGRLKERYRRAIIVCGYNAETHVFKGSGRSVEGIDLGHIIARAVKDGVILGGGGHAMAAGVRLKDEVVAGFQDWLDIETADAKVDFTPVLEVLGNADTFGFDEWISMLDALEPFGAGNPRPNLLIDGATLICGPRMLYRQADGKPWAAKATFKTAAGRQFDALWADLEQAGDLWLVGGTYRMVCNVSRQKQYENWNVVACESKSANP